MKRANILFYLSTPFIKHVYQYKNICTTEINFKDQTYVSVHQKVSFTTALEKRCSENVDQTCESIHKELVFHNFMTKLVNLSAIFSEKLFFKMNWRKNSID